ncbi:histidine protein kinase [Altererythrobacter sp. B11]|uniref:histidine kinase dimerization/phospho-acceptor domain-containing protein n=1 Tax=Altererythrobacter sp. B11 TaxID=2060312 RepID=UPI000DC71698|nr:histidine kinase dimerization/phospho-acceptor domain-containing protein [Altererythrobacter sp. B11]BBC73677.1 histidine protein kinase [Altererythrobacter sp. B11]
MLFDDRLATVLRSRSGSEAAARTEFRQLIDLLGSAPGSAEGELIDAAYARLTELGEALPAQVQSAVVRAPGLRLRNAELIGRLAAGEPQMAAAAMATAQLSVEDWLDLIPRLPMNARGFLRHRRGLPAEVGRLLERLGVTDLVLPRPAIEHAATPAPGAPTQPETQPAAPNEGIGALLRRIEAFREARRQGRDGAAAQHIAAESADAAKGISAFEFATDAKGAIDWAESGMAPLTIGMSFGPEGSGAGAELDAESLHAMKRRLPIENGHAVLFGPERIEGHWRVDAAPEFTGSGAFRGYAGRMRRDMAPADLPPADTPGAERMRQVLHELRTPVNAIQGFAEIIQQQMFGPAPNEYRALAAGIAVDAARLLAGFEEIDRLARLESGAMELIEGKCDLERSVATTLRRLQGVLRPRNARMDLATGPGPFTLGIAEAEALQLVWRMLAILAGGLAPGELIALSLSRAGDRLELGAELPAALSAVEDLFTASAPGGPRAISAGAFGTGFTLRLARAEAAAAGGELARVGDALVLHLPALTGPAAGHSVESTGTGGPAAGG